MTTYIDVPRVTSLRLLSTHETDRHPDQPRRETARLGLVAAMRPFGSLDTEWCRPADVADLMISAVDAGLGDRASLVAELVALVESAYGVDAPADSTYNVSLVEMGAHWIGLSTPTSRTTIRLGRRGVDCYELVVDFGPRGSDARADEIIEADDRLRWGVAPMPRTQSSESASVTCSMHVAELDSAPEVTIAGPLPAVLRVIARYAGTEVEVRHNPMSDDGLPHLVVDRAQAARYPACVAEILPDRTDAVPVETGRITAGTYHASAIELDEASKGAVGRRT